MSTVLLALAESLWRRSLVHLLHARDIRSIQVNRLQFASETALARADLIVTEYESDDASRLPLLFSPGRGERPPVILVAHRSSEDLAIAALRLGMVDYFRLCPSPEEVVESIVRVLDASRRAPAEPDVPPMIAARGPMREVADRIARVAATDANVLITGETGTGKEVVTAALHRCSPRRDKPLVCVNCAAIPETLLESELFGHVKGAFTGAETAQEGKLRQADGGTLMLDEVGDLSAQGQAKLLRTIETRDVFPLGGRQRFHVDIRVIASTNRDLEAMSREGAFRLDLLFRLNVIRFHLPPLRERASDIPALAGHFVEHFNRVWGRRIDGLDAGVLKLFAQYDWPGNVRELKNVIEAIYVNSDGGVVTIGDLPEPLRHLQSCAVEPEERRRLTQALFATNWNVSKAAEKLHWSRMTIYRKLQRYRISRTAPSHPPIESDTAGDTA